MTNKETIRKNIELTFDFVRQITDNPGLAEHLPDKCNIDFIVKDLTSLTEKDLKNKKLLKGTHTFKKSKINKSNGQTKQAIN